MKKSRFSEEQIIAVLREQEDGMKTADLCRKHGISSATLYAWKAKYGGMDVSQARKLKVLEDENARLKRLLADAMLDNAVLKEAAAKKIGEACRSAKGCRACVAVVRYQRASGPYLTCIPSEIRGGFFRMSRSSVTRADSRFS